MFVRVRWIISIVLLGIMAGPGTGFAHNGEVEASFDEEKHQHSHRDAEHLTLGETVYKHMCTFCHGTDGNGGGKAMAYLFPWPRDFRKGVFKYRTTPSGSLPLDSDLFKVISRGVPGTAMPAWGTALTEEETHPTGSV